MPNHLIAVAFYSCTFSAPSLTSTSPSVDKKDAKYDILIFKIWNLNFTFINSNICSPWPTVQTVLVMLTHFSSSPTFGKSLPVIFYLDQCCHHLYTCSTTRIASLNTDLDTFDQFCHYLFLLLTWPIITNNLFLLLTWPTILSNIPWHLWDWQLSISDHRGQARKPESSKW